MDSITIGLVQRRPERAPVSTAMLSAMRPVWAVVWSSFSRSPRTLLVVPVLHLAQVGEHAGGQCLDPARGVGAGRHRGGAHPLTGADLLHHPAQHPAVRLVAGLGHLHQHGVHRTAVPQALHRSGNRFVSEAGGLRGVLCRGGLQTRDPGLETADGPRPVGGDREGHAQSYGRQRAEDGDEDALGFGHLCRHPRPRPAGDDRGQQGHGQGLPGYGRPFVGMAGYMC